MSTHAISTHRASFTDAVRGEAAKLFGVRSTAWTLLALVVVSVGFSALACGSDSTEDDVVALSLFGLFFGQIAAVVLGTLAMSTEYTQGGIRTTLTAVPRRGVVLRAKAVVVAVVCFVAGLITALVSFELGQALLDADRSVSLGDPGTYRAVLGSALYLMLTGLFGLGLGTILRGSAGAITGALVLLLVAPPLLAGLGGSVGDFFQKYFTSNAGGQVVTTVPDSDLLGPWAGIGVFAIWALALLAIGFALLRSRDAASS